MAIDQTGTGDWDGKALSGSVVANGTPTKVSADHDAIHTLAAEFNEAHADRIGSARVPADRYLPGRWTWGPPKPSNDWY
jgi:hypothetical protein